MTIYIALNILIMYIDFTERESTQSQPTKTMTTETETFTSVFTDEEGNLVLEEEFETFTEAHNFCTRLEDRPWNSDVRHPDGTLEGVN